MRIQIISEGFGVQYDQFVNLKNWIVTCHSPLNTFAIPRKLELEFLGVVLY